MSAARSLGSCGRRVSGPSLLRRLNRRTSTCRRTFSAMPANGHSSKRYLAAEIDRWAGKEPAMRIPFDLPLNSTTMLVAGGIFLLVLFVVVATMGRKSLSGAPGSQSVDDRLNQYAGRTDRNKPEEVKAL